jgi:hypothetical protein
VNNFNSILFPCRKNNDRQKYNFFTDILIVLSKNREIIRKVGQGYVIAAIDRIINENAVKIQNNRCSISLENPLIGLCVSKHIVIYWPHEYSSTMSIINRKYLNT